MQQAASCTAKRHKGILKNISFFIFSIFVYLIYSPFFADICLPLKR
ncbi:hypothetical protein HMPREF0971_00742 [Segatella oris F0302]|uniref:Uncharacterized protein n=1 Tax=Segatella oris F0302 TaxID=649760 RepID=D1QP52_9BACT|nr:hypothetical protein HMPREF0971_00742 [Segatella oris F0302]